MRAHAGITLLLLLGAGCIDRPQDLDQFADNDGDGLPNFEEANRGTDPEVSDTDKDGLSDWEEIYRYYTDPLDPDSDNDTLWDSIDPAPNDANNDEDGDGYLDQFDQRIYNNLSFDLAIDWAVESNNVQLFLFFEESLVWDRYFDEDENGTMNQFYDWPDDLEEISYSFEVRPGDFFNGTYLGYPLSWDYYDEPRNNQVNCSLSFTENE